MFKNKISVIIILLIFSFSAKAQNIDIGVFGGVSYYIGELNPGTQFLFSKPAFGGISRINFNNRWAVKVNAYFGKLEGDDVVSKTNVNRNLRFQSSITDISVQLEFNFKDYFTGSYKNYFSPFIFVGPGFFLFKPKAEFNGETYSLRDIGTEGQNIDSLGKTKYNLYGIALVFGFGIKYSLTNRIGLGLEWGMRKTFTDYIDDVSTTYYLDFDKLDPQQVGANQILSDPSVVKHKPGMQRGNSENNDWFSFAGLTITYRFNLSQKSTCTDFENTKNK